MWGMCHPKDDKEMAVCSELGKSLNRLSQPTILCILAAANQPIHGYIIVQEAAKSPMFGGKKPDATGIYRSLKKLEESGYVTSRWDTPEEGSAKRLFTLTDEGRDCLRRWIDSLACYQLTLGEFRQQASNALEIDLPDAPVCAHSIPEFLRDAPVSEFHQVAGRDVAGIQGPRPVNIVGAFRANGQADFATCVWVTPLSYEPPLVAFSLKHTSKTLETVQESGVFSLSIMSAEAESLETMSVCGNMTGHKTNKGELVDFATLPLGEGKSSVPVLNQAYSYELCEVVSIQDTGDHKLVIGTVVQASTSCGHDKRSRVLPADTLLCIQHDKFAQPRIIL